MKVGLIVDGDAEFASLPHVLPRIDSKHEVLPRVLKAALHPLGGPGKVARAVMPAVRIFVANKGVRQVVIILDREQQTECCGAIAGDITRAVSRLCENEGLRVEVSVVLKDRTNENRLLSDPEALRASAGRFRVTAALTTKVQPNKADTAEAGKLIKTIVAKGSYDKVEDGVRIMKAADPARMGANSRSFRRLLRVVGDRTHSKQSKLPALPPQGVHR
jgi:hypothetical protein